MSINNKIEIRKINKLNDIQNFVDFYNMAHRDYPGHNDINYDIAKEYVFDIPDFDEDSQYLAIMDSTIIGDVKGEIYAETNGIIRLLVMPEFRDKGIEGLLVSKIMDYFNDHELNTIKVIMPARFEELANYFINSGYKHTKSGYWMKCDLSLFNPVGKELPDSTKIRVADLETEKESIIKVLAEGFSSLDDTDGIINDFNNVSKEDYFDPAGIFVAKDNEVIVGAVVNLIHPALPTTGFINWLAVLPPERHKGLGKGLLTASLIWFKLMTIETVELNVDLDNPNALNLYKKCGFVISSENIFLELDISN